MSSENKKNTGLKIAALALTTAAAAAAYFKATYDVFKKCCMKGYTHFPLGENGKLIRQSNTGWLNTINHQDLMIDSVDGLKLHGIYIPAIDSTHETIILVHGYDSDSTQMLPLAKSYHYQNYNVLAIDLRCHGQSEGEYITFGAKESDDINSWMDYLLQVDSNAKIMLHGVSMGATSALLASAKVMHTSLKGVISDCGYTSFEDQLRYLTKKHFHLPGNTFLPGVSFWIKKVAQFDYQSANALNAICIKGVPTLFFHGQNDTFVPCEMVYRLANALQSASIVEILPYKNHAQCMYDTNYMNKCLLFAQKQMLSDE